MPAIARLDLHLAHDAALEDRLVVLVTPHLGEGEGEG